MLSDQYPSGKDIFSSAEIMLEVRRKAEACESRRNMFSEYEVSVYSALLKKLGATNLFQSYFNYKLLVERVALGDLLFLLCHSIYQYKTMTLEEIIRQVAIVKLLCNVYLLPSIRMKFHGVSLRLMVSDFCKYFTMFNPELLIEDITVSRYYFEGERLHVYFSPFDLPYLTSFAARGGGEFAFYPIPKEWYMYDLEDYYERGIQTRFNGEK